MMIFVFRWVVKAEGWPLFFWNPVGDMWNTLRICGWRKSIQTWMAVLCTYGSKRSLYYTRCAPLFTKFRNPQTVTAQQRGTQILVLAIHRDSRGLFFRAEKMISWLLIGRWIFATSGGLTRHPRPRSWLAKNCRTSSCILGVNVDARVVSPPIYTTRSTPKSNRLNNHLVLRSVTSCPSPTMLETIYVTRHGFRADWITPDFPSPTGLPHDPPLADIGARQARELAAFLGDKPIERIYSSPFYRCLQTTNEVAEKLDLDINVESGLR